MTPAELRYLLTLDKLYDGTHGVKLTDIAKQSGVSKVSTLKAITQLEVQELTARDLQKHIYITEKGAVAVREALDSVEFITDFLEKDCGIDGDKAATEAINAVAALKDDTRAAVARALREKKSGV